VLQYFCMWKLIIIFPVLFVFLLFVTPVRAASDKAYQDYLYQFDVYRQKNNDFKVAKDEYNKFKTLNSETTLLDKTRQLLTQRDFLLKTYLIVLSEKLRENQGLTSADSSLYQTLITNENLFLDDHMQLINSIGTIQDAEQVSEKLSSHYLILSTSIRQIIIGLALGKLTNLSNEFDMVYRNLQSFENSHRTNLSSAKQIIADRWLVSIESKRNLHQQKINEIVATNAKMKSSSLEDLDRIMNDAGRGLSEARVYLQEASSYMGELVNSMRYSDE
jgi:hypothetical protein